MKVIFINIFLGLIFTPCSKSKRFMLRMSVKLIANKKASFLLLAFFSL